MTILLAIALMPLLALGGLCTWLAKLCCALAPWAPVNWLARKLLVRAEAESNWPAIDRLRAGVQYGPPYVTYQMWNPMGSNYIHWHELARGVAMESEEFKHRALELQTAILELTGLSISEIEEYFQQKGLTSPWISNS